MFTKIIAGVVSIGFVLTSVPVSYADTDALRTPAVNRSSGRLDDIQADLGKKGNPEKIDPLVLSNIISLLEGAQTGGSNIEHAMADGANGGIFNHSERRGRLEIMMENMLRSIGALINNGAPYETRKNRWVKTLKTENLSDKEIEGSLLWLNDFENGEYGIEYLARSLVNYIMNIQLKKVIAYSDKHPIAQTVLCVGETKEQRQAGKTQEVLEQDLEEILAGITKEQARKIGLRIAYEPRWAINQQPPVTPDPLTEIQPTHRFIKDTSVKILDTDLDVDYGGGLNEKNCAEILSLTDVDGGLIGGAAKDPKKISVVIDEAIKQGRDKEKLLNVGMNWKAEDASTGLSPLDAFVALFRTKDLSKVRIAIGTPNVKLVRDTMTKLENELSAVSLYSGIVVKTETVGPFTKETLAAKSETTKAIYVELEKRFGEASREGDVYFRLKLGNRYFALGKENSKDQTLMTAATLDLTDSKTKAEYYGALFDYVTLVTLQANKGIEWIEEKGDRLKQYLASTLITVDKSVSMTFKNSDRPIARGWSLLVQPKTAETKVAAQKPAQELYTAVPWLVNRKSELKDKRVVSRVDWNVPNLNSIIRIRASIPGILNVLENGGTPIIATHYGRPGGKVDLKYSVKPLVASLKKLLAEQGKGDIPVNFLEGSVTEKGLQEGLKAKIIPGAINVLENTRFCPGDEKNDPAFAKALAELGDSFNFAGFGAGERVHASTAGLAEYMDEIVLDPLTVKEEQTIRGLLKTLYGVIFGGGPKVSEKIGALTTIVSNIKEGGYVIIGTGPLPAFLKAMYNIEIGQKAEDADVAAAGEIIGLAEKRNIKILLPADFSAVKFAGKDISEQRIAAEAMVKSKKIPPDAKIYNVTLEQLKQGPFVNNNIGEKISSQNVFVYDIGPTSISEFKQVVRNTPKDNTIFWNGTVGVNEMPAFETGTKEMAITLGEVSKNATRPEGVNGVTGGGDTAAAMEQFGVDQQLTFVSTGGGALLALLEGKELTAIEKLAEIQATRNAVAEKFNIGVNDYIGYVNNDITIHNAQGGRAFSTFTDDVLKYLQALSPEALKNMKTQAIIVDPNFFRAGGVKGALETVAKLSRVVRIALYGENADKIRTLIGNKNIIIARDIDSLYSELSRLSIGNTIVLRSQDELPESVQLALNQAGDTQIVSSQLATLAIAKAIKELFNVKEVDNVFEKFLDQIKTDNIISEKAYNDNRAKLLAKLEKGKVFEFSPDLKPAPEITEITEIEAARKKYEEFLVKIGV